MTDLVLQPLLTLLFGSSQSDMHHPILHQLYVEGANERCCVRQIREDTSRSTWSLQLGDELAHCASLRSMLGGMLMHGARKGLVVWDDKGQQLRETLVLKQARIVSLRLPPLGDESALLQLSIVCESAKSCWDVPGSVVEPLVVAALSKQSPQERSATLWLPHNFSITIEGLSVETCLQVTRVEALQLVSASSPSTLACSNLVFYVNLHQGAAASELVAWYKATLSKVGRMLAKQTCILSMFGGSGIGGISLYGHVVLQSCRHADDGHSLRVECIVHDTRLLW
jgi:hypothetical protein